MLGVELNIFQLSGDYDAPVWWELIICQFGDCL